MNMNLIGSVVVAGMMVWGSEVGAWSKTALLFAATIYFGLDRIADAIRYRPININWNGPIRLKHIYEEED